MALGEPGPGRRRRDLVADEDGDLAHAFLVVDDRPLGRGAGAIDAARDCAPRGGQGTAAAVPHHPITPLPNHPRHVQEYVASIAANAASLCPTCNEPLSVELAPKPADAGAYHGQGAPGAGVTAAGHARRGILSRIDLGTRGPAGRRTASDGRIPTVLANTEGRAPVDTPMDWCFGLAGTAAARFHARRSPPCPLCRVGWLPLWQQRDSTPADHPPCPLCRVGWLPLALEPKAFPHV